MPIHIKFYKITIQIVFAESIILTNNAISNLQYLFNNSKYNTLKTYGTFCLFFDERLRYKMTKAPIAGRLYYIKVYFGLVHIYNYSG